MSRKLVIKLVATVMAMTMVLGMGMTASAACCSHTYEWVASNCGGYHFLKCSACGDENLCSSVAHTAPCHVCGYGVSWSSGPSISIAEQRNNEAAAAIEATIAAEEAIPVTALASEGAVSLMPAEVKASGVDYNLTAVTTTKGFISAVEKITKSSADAAIDVYDAKPIAFNKDSLAAVAKTGKAFSYTFNYDGHIYKITIPAGASVDLAGQTFAGPLAIGAQLGTTQVIK